MPRVTLTPKFIPTLPLPIDRKSIDYFDRRIPGLVLRASAGGSRTWNVLYRHEGRARRLTLGRCDVISLDDANSRARQTLCDVTRGADPARAEPEPTFGDLAYQLIAQHVSSLKRSRQTARLIERELVVHWRTRRASSITRRDVALLLGPGTERAPVLANRVHATLRRRYSWALSQGIVSSNLCDGVERPTREKARERVLSEKEIAALWSTLGHLDVTWRVLFQLCLLIGQRVGEVLATRWSDIDGDVWTITDTKNGRSHRVPLTLQALQKLAELPRRGEYLLKRAALELWERHLQERVVRV